MPHTHRYFIMKNVKHREVERIREESTERAGLPEAWRVALSDICGMLCFRFRSSWGLTDILGMRRPILTLTDGASVMFLKSPRTQK